MKIPIVFKVTFISILAIGTANVWAVSSPGLKRLSLAAGAVFPTGENYLSRSAGIGPAGGFQYLYEVDENFGVGLQVDYFRFGSKNYTLVNNDTDGQMDTRSWDDAATLEVMGRYNLIPNATFAPYLHSGVGAAYFHQKSDGTPLPGSTWTDTGTTETRQIQNNKSLGVAFSFGLGVEKVLNEKLVMGLEAAWHIFGVKKSTYGTSTIGAPTVLLRLAWRFGHQPKTLDEPIDP